MYIFYYYSTASKHQINEEFKKNKTVSDPATVQNV